jgi:hypothetical protein
MQKRAVIPVYIGYRLVLVIMIKEPRCNTYISPRIILRPQIKCLRIIRSSRILTEGTRRRVRIKQITRLLRQEAGHVLSAGLTRGRLEVDQFLGLALYLDVPENLAEETADKVREGVEVVEPVAPEGLHLGVRNDDTAETDHPGADEDGVHDCSEVFVGSVGGDGLADGCIEKFID